MTEQAPTDGPDREQHREDPPKHPDTAAELRERGDGAHAEQLAGETNLREDETPPGVDPDSDDADAF